MVQLFRPVIIFHTAFLIYFMERFQVYKRLSYRLSEANGDNLYLSSYTMQKAVCAALGLSCAYGFERSAFVFAERDVLQQVKTTEFKIPSAIEPYLRMGKSISIALTAEAVICFRLHFSTNVYKSSAAYFFLSSLPNPAR